MSSSTLVNPTTVGLSTLVGLITPKAAHLLLWGYAFGVNTWQTFAGGIIAFKSLPRLQFRSLQAAVFPWYFRTNTVAATGLLLHQLYAHPLLSSSSAGGSRSILRSAAGFQALLLGANLVGHGANWLSIGPKATKVMLARAKLEREEGKAYSDEGVSEKMKALNKEFSTLHGISSLLNLVALISVGLHGLWIANYGI